MGGKPREGYCVVGGEVPVWVRDKLDELARIRFQESRSKTIKCLLTNFLNIYDVEALKKFEEEAGEPEKMEKEYAEDNQSGGK